LLFWDFVGPCFDDGAAMMLGVGRKGGGEEEEEEEAAQAQSKCFRAYNLPDMLLKHEDNVWGNV